MERPQPDAHRRGSRARGAGRRARCPSRNDAPPRSRMRACVARRHESHQDQAQRRGQRQGRAAVRAAPGVRGTGARGAPRETPRPGAEGDRTAAGERREGGEGHGERRHHRENHAAGSRTRRPVAVSPARSRGEPDGETRGEQGRHGHVAGEVVLAHEGSERRERGHREAAVEQGAEAGRARRSRRRRGRSRRRPPPTRRRPPASGARRPGAASQARSASPATRATERRVESGSSETGNGPLPSTAAAVALGRVPHRVRSRGPRTAWSGGRERNDLGQPEGAEAEQGPHRDHRATQVPPHRAHRQRDPAARSRQGGDRQDGPGLDRAERPGRAARRGPRVRRARGSRTGCGRSRARVGHSTPGVCGRRLETREGYPATARTAESDAGRNAPAGRPSR